MSVLYNIVQRQVFLRSNQLKADSATALASAYAVTDIDDGELGDRAIEFPFKAINDAILNAGDKMVGAIGGNKLSPYRKYFADVTNNIASGGVIPTTSATSKPIIGAIGDVRNASAPNQRLNFADEHIIKGYNTLATNIVKINPYLYYENGKRIWHTATNVLADVVIWSKTDQTALMESTPNRGTCPFPEDLIEGLVCGALSYIFRGDFNLAQVEQWKAYFNDTIQMLRGTTSGETET